MAPTYQYYAKVSEVLEKIIDEERKKEEVEPLTDGEKLFLFTLAELCQVHGSIEML